MKKLIVLFFAFSSFFILNTLAIAQTTSFGSATVPGITRLVNGNNMATSQITLSNISNDTIKCKILFFDNNGVERGSECTILNGNNNAPSAITISEGSELNIPPNCSRTVQFYKNYPQNLFGYAIVRWESSNEKTSKALIGIHQVYSGNGTGITNTIFPINNGQPF